MTVKELKKYQRKIWWHNFLVGFIKGVLLGAAILSCLYGIYRLDRASCLRKFAEFNPEFTMIGGCMITVDEQRVPSDSLRMTL